MKHYTRKEINNIYNYVIAIPYCDASALLKSFDRVGYNSGVYGWNFDLYAVGDNTAITTGYRNLTGARVDRATLRNYETQARAVWNNYNLDYDIQVTKTRELLKEFLQAVK